MYVKCDTCHRIFAKEQLVCPGCWRSSYTDINIHTGEHMNPMDTQVGGGHYKDMQIQPMDYILENELGWCEGNIIKLASRHEKKGGKEDVEKIIHYAQIILKKKYGGT